ncbi:MAG: hypothetical protein H6709_24165 [Kofleriaceae bacterium]|nr:hypothetical protein [Kofleriaceae bacterium]
MTGAEPPTPEVLVVTSAGAHAAVVVPVLAALEAAGMRVRAIDVGAAGGGGASVGDRLRRALLGESAERRLRRELESNPPDVAIAFDPHATQALTVARDQATAPTPVIAVVGDLDPVKEWGESGADRYCAVDDPAAVGLADHGVEGERVLVVGAFGPRAFADAGREDRGALRTRFKLGGSVALVEVAGLGAEKATQLAMQLSLASVAERMTFLFDAGDDVDAAAALRRQVPALGLRAKLFGATADAPLLWRAADIVVAVPRDDGVAKAALVGARLVALLDDTVAGAARTAAAVEGRGTGVTARSPLLVSSAIEAVARGAALTPLPDGADRVADVAWVVAGDKRAVVEERRASARAETREKVRAATTAAQAAARATAAPGDLEDLSGGVSFTADVDAPDPSELGRLQAETQARKQELERAMMSARSAAENWTRLADSARGAGKGDDARDAERKADAERARMHSLLGELGQIEAELAELARAVDAATRARRRRPRRAPPSSRPRPPTPPTKISGPRRPRRARASTRCWSASSARATPRRAAPAALAVVTACHGARPAARRAGPARPRAPRNRRSRTSWLR